MIISFGATLHVVCNTPTHILFSSCKQKLKLLPKRSCDVLHDTVDNFMVHSKSTRPRLHCSVRAICRDIFDCITGSILFFRTAQITFLHPCYFSGYPRLHNWAQVILQDSPDCIPGLILFFRITQTALLAPHFS